MKSREFRERLLIALVRRALATDLGSFLDPVEIADEAGLDRRPGQLRMVIDDLDARDFVKVSRTMGGGDEGGLDLRLTNAAFEEVEELLDQHPEYAEEAPTFVPAADRWVAPTHNDRRLIAADLVELRRAVSSVNEVEEGVREIALSEIAAFEGTIAQPRVAIDLIERFVNRILNWLRSKFPEAVLGGIIGLLIERLSPFAG